MTKETVDKNPEAPHLAKIAQTRLAKNLHLLRKRKDVTQEDLAGRTGLSPRHIQKLEAGQVNATLKTIAVLADALQVELHKLLSPDLPKGFRGPTNGT